jgi:hypothetical protein
MATKKICSFLSIIKIFNFPSDHPFFLLISRQGVKLGVKNALLTLTIFLVNILY